MERPGETPGTGMTLFDPMIRDRLRDRLIEQAHADPRIVAAAAVGSSASGGDRWSDLDLTFAVAPDVERDTVLADWSRMMVADFDAVILFDLPHRSSIYRVFLLPGMLQVDLSFTPAADFGATGSRFALLFGTAIEHPVTPPLPADQVVGLCVHHLVRAHICIERGRLWQAEYWIHSARDEALALACRRYGLESREGRGLDHLPTEALDPWRGTLVAEITAPALRRACARAAGALLLLEDERTSESSWLRRALDTLAGTSV